MRQMMLNPTDTGLSNYSPVTLRSCDPLPAGVTGKQPESTHLPCICMCW